MSATGAAESVNQQREAFQQYMDFDSLVRSCTPDVKWLPDGRSVAYFDGAPDDATVQRLDLPSGTRSPLFDVHRLRAGLREVLGYEPPYRGMPFRSYTLRGESADFQIDGTDYQLNLADYSVRRVAKSEALEEMFGISPRARHTPQPFKREMFLAGESDALEVPSPDGTWFASLRDHNVWVRSTVDGRSLRLTSDGTFDAAWDVEVGVHSPWAPGGRQLFAIRYDRGDVFKLPRVHFLKGREELDFTHLQKTGGPLDRADLHILSTLGNPPVQIDVGDTKDHYFRVLGWRTDGSEVLFARFSRLLDHVDLMAADPSAGTARTILTETSRTFVRLPDQVLWAPSDLGFTPLSSGRGFLWQSERNGWNHLYLYDWQGRLQRQLTLGAFPVHEIVAVDESAGYVYYTASAEPRVYDRHLYRVALTGGKPQRLTDGDGVHRVRFAPSNAGFVDTVSTVASPPRTEVRRADGELVASLGVADISALQRVGWVPPEPFVVTAADGSTELHGVLYRPRGFDASQRYPLIEYVYGGPQTSVTPRTFCVGGLRDARFPQALTQYGYAVAILDARGTPGRSKAFQDVVYRSWADHVIADHAGAIRQLLAKHAWLDPDRVGVYGRSWGGYFAFRLLAEQPHVYRAAVSVVPGFDPFNGILYEAYLGDPTRDPKPYEAADVFGLAPRISDPLMLVGTTLDTGTYTDVMRMSNALIEADVPFDLVLVPNQEHQILGQPGAYVRDAIVRFFERNVAGVEARSGR